MTELTVVIISKNQAWNISRLIESVIRETAPIHSKEIVLVDSSSTDNTTEIAAEYPITILRLHPTQHLTPSAGRYIGYQNTTGKFILFLDGDMELVEKWLEQALQLLTKEPEIALVTGEVIDLPLEAKTHDKPPLALNVPSETREILRSGGAAIFRRSVLEEVGTFNPYLYSDEEPELCIRIRYGGYRIVCLDYPIAYHYTAASKKITSLYGRWQRRLYLGAGQSIRYHVGSELLWIYIKERGYGIIPGLGILAGLFSFLWSMSTGQKALFRFWLVVFFALILGDTIRKRSLYKTLASLLERLLILDGTIRGFLLKPKNPETYPEEVEVIKPLAKEL